MRRYWSGERALTDATRTELVGVGLGAVAALAFGTLAIFAKMAYQRGADVFPLLAARFAVTSVLLVSYHALRGVSLRFADGRSMMKVLPLGAAYAFESSLFFLALQHAPAAVVSLVFYSFPLWTTLMAFGLRLERIAARTIGALVLGSAGVVLIFSIPGTGMTGPLIALAAAFAVAAYLIAAQISLRTVTPSVAATWTAIGATAVLGIVTLIRTEGLPSASYGPTLGLGLATAIAFMAFYEAIARIGSARTAVSAMLEPVTTVALAALILNESLTLRVAAGAALVVSALPILATRRAEMPPSPDAM